MRTNTHESEAAGTGSSENNNDNMDIFLQRTFYVHFRFVYLLSGQCTFRL